MSDRVVITDIPIGDPGRGVFAYRVGDKVSEQQVKDNGWDEYVVGANTQEARNVLSKLTGEPIQASSTKSRTEQKG